MMGEDDMEAALYASLPAGMLPPAAQGYDPMILSAALGLSVHQGQVLCLLLSNSLTLLADIERQLGIAGEGRRTLICRLRQRLQRNKIEIITHPSMGYSIPAEARARIAEIVAKFRSI
jgi:hypothetical protein